MAKSSRSSIRKTNNKRLKSRVFGPAEDARTKRLSEKLLELASQPKESSTSMDTVDDADDQKPSSGTKENDGVADDTNDADMDVDEVTSKESKPISHKEEKRRKVAKASRIEKKRHRKVTNTMVFGKKGAPRRKTKR